jgi:hypothetical protein
VHRLIHRSTLQNKREKGPAAHGAAEPDSSHRAEISSAHVAAVHAHKEQRHQG